MGDGTARHAQRVEEADHQLLLAVGGLLGVLRGHRVQQDPRRVTELLDVDRT